jgi:hypothetical protein
VREHKLVPEFIEMFRRYQCKVCKVWVGYSEWDGKWRHLPYRSQA